MSSGDNATRNLHSTYTSTLYARLATNLFFWPLATDVHTSYNGWAGFQVKLVCGHIFLLMHYFANTPVLSGEKYKLQQMQ